jgi:hypothetical protein
MAAAPWRHVAVAVVAAIVATIAALTQRALRAPPSTAAALPPPLSLGEGTTCPWSYPRAGGEWHDDCVAAKLPDFRLAAALPAAVQLPRDRPGLVALRDRLARFAFDRQSQIIQHGLEAGCPAKVVAYLCSPGMTCGGLGDRVRGVVIAFWQALLTSSVFVTHLTSPLPHTLFFENAVMSPALQRAWLSCREGGRVASWVAIDANDEPAFDYRRAWRGAAFVQVVTNAAPYSVIWGNPTLARPLERLGLANLSYPLAASVAISLYHARPTPLLRGVAAPLVAALQGGEPGVFRVGLQIRTGGDGSFADPPRHPVAVTAQFVARALEACAARGAALCALYLTSDHPRAVEIVEEWLLQRGQRAAAPAALAPHAREFALPLHRVRLVYLDRAIIHVDRPAAGGGAAGVEATGKTYADWYVLAYHTDFLLISSSGYGVAAALANFTEHLMFVRERGFVDTAACDDHHCLQLRGAW